MKTLPIEVFEEIVKNFDEYEQRQYRPVCKFWNQVLTYSVRNSEDVIPTRLTNDESVAKFLTTFGFTDLNILPMVSRFDLDLFNLSLEQVVLIGTNFGCYVKEYRLQPKRRIHGFPSCECVESMLYSYGLDRDAWRLKRELYDEKWAFLLHSSAQSLEKLSIHLFDFYPCNNWSGRFVILQKLRWLQLTLITKTVPVAFELATGFLGSNPFLEQLGIRGLMEYQRGFPRNCFLVPWDSQRHRELEATLRRSNLLKNVRNLMSSCTILKESYRPKFQIIDVLFPPSEEAKSPARQWNFLNIQIHNTMYPRTAQSQCLLNDLSEALIRNGDILETIHIHVYSSYWISLPSLPRLKNLTIYERGLARGWRVPTTNFQKRYQEDELNFEPLNPCDFPSLTSLAVMGDWTWLEKLFAGPFKRVRDLDITVGNRFKPFPLGWKYKLETHFPHVRFLRLRGFGGFGFLPDKTHGSMVDASFLGLIVDSNTSEFNIPNRIIWNKLSRLGTVELFDCELITLYHFVTESEKGRIEPIQQLHVHMCSDCFVVSGELTSRLNLCHSKVQIYIPGNVYGSGLQKLFRVFCSTPYLFH